MFMISNDIRIAMDTRKISRMECAVKTEIFLLKRALDIWICDRKMMQN